MARYIGLFTLICMGAAFLFFVWPRNPHTASLPFTHSAYIWQRAWTGAVSQAVAKSGPYIKSWHVLFAQVDVSGRVFQASPDIALLERSGHVVIPVVRIDGRTSFLDKERFPELVVKIWKRWHQAFPSAGQMEIDYDCPTSQLFNYTRFIVRLRELLPSGVKIYVTALPSWMAAPRALRALLQGVDGSVLQVHAVSTPTLGIMQNSRSLRWVTHYAAYSGKPFWVALPTYGSQIVWDKDGHIVSVQSESLSLIQGEGRQELLAAPETVEGFLKRLKALRPQNMAGVVWFRLPTRSDQRTWSLETWLRIVKCEPLEKKLAIIARQDPNSGGWDAWVENRGGDDVLLPAKVGVPEQCRFFDGINSYEARRDSSGRWLERRRKGLLRPGHRQRIGWLRCVGKKVVLHAG